MDDPRPELELTPADLAFGRYWTGWRREHGEGDALRREAQAFGAGWDAHIDFVEDRNKLRAEATRGCAVPMIALGGILALSVLAVVAVGLSVGMPFIWSRVGLCVVAGLGLVAIGRALLRKERTDYREARRGFDAKWKRP